MVEGAVATGGIVVHFFNVFLFGVAFRKISRIKSAVHFFGTSPLSHPYDPGMW